MNGGERTVHPLPNLFLNEVDGALDLLGQAPGAGRHYPHPTLKGVRRILLQDSRYHVYYARTQSGILVLAEPSRVDESAD